jgi:23S rRNA (guanosine2251-2'-O)-methyltransferase
MPLPDSAPTDMVGAKLLKHGDADRCMVSGISNENKMKETSSSECSSQPIFGIKPIIEAIDAGKPIDRLFIQKGLKSPHFPPLWERIKAQKIPFRYVPLDRLRRVTTKNHQGVVAYLSPISITTIEQVIPAVYESGKDPFLVILDRVTDVGNFGAIVRSAEVAGAHAVIIPEKNSAPLSGDAVKTSAGALMRLPVCRERKLAETVQQLKAFGIRIVAITEKSKHSIYDMESVDGPLALMMGSEEDGIGKELLDIADQAVHIPMFGKLGSLNVSVATGIALFECVRRRTVTTAP